MKKTLMIIIILIYLLTIPSMAFGDETNSHYYTQATRIDAPDWFLVNGLTYQDDNPPFHKLQNSMHFTLVDMKTVRNIIDISYPADSEYGPSEHHMEIDLLYDKQAFLDGQEIFITGTFIYSHILDGEELYYQGTISGEYVIIENSVHDETFNNQTSIRLYLEVDNEDWEWEIFLIDPVEFQSSPVINNTNDIVRGYNEETIIEYNEVEYCDYEISPHIPQPYTQKQVAVGIGISSISIVLLNSLTNTSVFGSTSFNMGSTLGGTTTQSTSQAANQVATTGSTQTTGFIDVIKKFFMKLFANLRDMLTDEGRSYASGRLSDTIEDINIDIDKEN